MLGDEDGIIQDGYQPQNCLDHIELRIQESQFQDHLEEGKKTSSGVSQHVEDGPSLGGLSLIVPIHLRTVLDDSEGQLQIAHQTEQTPLGCWSEGMGCLY